LIAVTPSNASAGSSAASQTGELDAGVVERHLQLTERVDGGRDHGGDLVLDGDIARHREHLVPVGGQLVGDRGERRTVDVGQHHGGTGFGERAGCWPAPCRSWRR
jgi:hypothetical protein